MSPGIAVLFVLYLVVLFVAIKLIRAGRDN
jgi:hypothetical protein